MKNQSMEFPPHLQKQLDEVNQQLHDASRALHVVQQHYQTILSMRLEQTIALDDERWEDARERLNYISTHYYNIIAARIAITNTINQELSS